jgi:glucose/arabinose dehydrogenase
MAFIGPNDFLVLEKATGSVQRVLNGVIEGTALDLAVNSNSERGLLGITLHPNFPTNPGVYLFWTESTTGADSTVVSEVPLLGNRVDRFVWNGTTLTFERNIIQLRARQTDNVAVPGHPGTNNANENGNHNGGVVKFGPDGKLYLLVGDVGRRGWLQNLADGPFPTTPFVDDTFGGPASDNAHLSGVILRLNDDGTTPTDNPFFAAGAAMGGEVGANLQKIFSYGHRNSFGMAFDSQTGNLWAQENGDDAFDELNRVEPGMNGGWVQIMGPVGRIADFKTIETASANGLQQTRWPPTLIADTPADALSRLFMLPGAHYSDPEFSWKFNVAPAGIGFLNSQSLGSQFFENLFVGAGRDLLEGGYLFRFNFSSDRKNITVSDPRLADQVADNTQKFDIAESESLLFGRDFGIGTDIQTGPNGNLFVVSLSHGAIYEIFRNPVVVNNLVSFVPLGGTFQATSNTTGCPSGFVGKFSFNARLTDKNSSPPLFDLMAKVTTLTNGNLLQNADGGPAGVGATLTVPEVGSFSDGVLSPGESVDVPFIICLKNTNQFTFFVDVLGIEGDD